MIRVVVDPGVFISALIGSPEGAPDLVMRGSQTTGSRSSLAHSCSTSSSGCCGARSSRDTSDQHAAHEFVERVRRHAVAVDDPVDRPQATRDRKDDYLVALAREEKVDALVSGDRDLVGAGLSKPGVWTPRQMVDRLLEGQELA